MLTILLILLAALVLSMLGLSFVVTLSVVGWILAVYCPIAFVILVFVTAAAVGIMGLGHLLDPWPSYRLRRGQEIALGLSQIGASAGIALMGLFLGGL
jgi:hypothetical protein